MAAGVGYTARGQAGTGGLHGPPCSAPGAGTDMIWESTAIMTLIDVAICGFAIVAIVVATRARHELRAAGAVRAVWIVIFGLTVIGGFYFVDLWVMHVLPGYATPRETMETMERLHLDWNWIVSLVAVGSIFFGLFGMVRSETGLLARIRDTDAELHEGVEKRASIEAALASAQARLAGALRAARMVTFDYDVIEGTIEWSERTPELFGVEPHKIDSSVQTYIDLIHPDDVEMMRQAVVSALKRGGSYAVEHRTILPSGETRWLAGRGWVYLDDEGRATKMTGVGWDITDHRRALEAKKDAERRSAEADRRLSRQQRLESLGTLSGGIAHDFNNLLTPIIGHVELLKDQIRNPDQIESLGQIQIAAERARGLVQQILAFSGHVELGGP